MSRELESYRQVFPLGEQLLNNASYESDIFSPLNQFGNFNNSAFYPLVVFIGFLWFLE
jgi:hypothetical protein